MDDGFAFRVNLRVYGYSMETIVHGPAATGADTLKSFGVFSRIIHLLSGSQPAC